MKKLVLFFALISLFACNDDDQIQKIVGEWQCKSWIVTGTGIDKCDGNVFFKFNADKTYRSQLGAVQDSGTFKIKNSILYTLPEGKKEIAVEIIKLDDTTLKFLMNQGGQEEIMTLAKK